MFKEKWLPRERTQRFGLIGGVIAVALLIVCVGQTRLQARIASWPTPEMQALEGSIDSLHLMAAVPTLQVHTLEGRTVEVLLDSQETVVLRNGQVQTLDHLSKGQRVKAYLTQRDGKTVANSIVIVSPPVTFPPAKLDTDQRAGEIKK